MYFLLTKVNRCLNCWVHCDDWFNIILIIVENWRKKSNEIDSVLSYKVRAVFILLRTHSIFTQDPSFTFHTFGLCGAHCCCCCCVVLCCAHHSCAYAWVHNHFVLRISAWNFIWTSAISRCCCNERQWFSRCIHWHTHLPVQFWIEVFVVFW